MLRERNASDGVPPPTGVQPDDGKVVMSNDDAGGPSPADGGGAVKTSAASGDPDSDASASTGAADDGKAADGGKTADGGAGDDAAADGGEAPVANPVESAKCKRTRQSAQDAYQRRAWTELLGHVAGKTCWKGKYRGDYADMKIKGLFETKQFAKCAALEKGARSSEAKSTVKTCLQRAAMDG
jgi:hypothetical protein